MSEKKYSLHEVTESLRISPDTLYRWESQIPDLKPAHCEGRRLYTGWEFDLLQHAHRLFHNYNQDFAGTRSALERWISKNPKPVERDVDPSSPEDQEPEQPQALAEEPEPQIERSSSQTDDSKPPSPQRDLSVPPSRKLNIERSSPSPQILSFSEPEVVQQDGGKQRVIGRTDEDLFADLDSDPFDLSPRNEGDDPFSLASAPAQRRESEELTPALTRLERRFSPPNSSHHISEATDSGQGRIEQPSSSDWLEGSTSVEIRALEQEEHPQIDLSVTKSSVNHKEVMNARQHFEPKRAFTQSQLPPVEESARSSTSVDEPRLSYEQSEPHSPLSIKSNALSEAKAVQLKPIPVKRSERSKGNASQNKSIQTPYGSASSSSHFDRALSSRLRPQSPSAPTSQESSTLSLSESASNDLSEHSPSNIPLPLDPKDQDSWQRAYHHSQAQLARAKGDLAKAQDQNQRQKKEIKRLQAQLLSIRESILKEIYDLRDLVVDK